MSAETGPRDAVVRVGDLALHYVEWGPVDAPPVVLLHGITGHARVWDRLARALAARFRVLALDQRGHGDSAAPADADYRVAAMAADLAGFADALHLRRLSLVGHSLGGRIAIAYAAEHADRVDRLVLVDIGPDIHLPGLRRVREMMAQAPELIESEEWAIDYIGRANPLSDPEELRHRVRHGLRRRPDGTLTWKYDKGLRDMMRQGTRDPIDLWAPLARIASPTLLVRGRESDILSTEVAGRMLEVLPRGELVEVDRAGHTVPGDQPEAFARVVSAFLGL
jgi:esterase